MQSNLQNGRPPTSTGRRVMTGCILLFVVAPALLYLGLRAIGAFLITGDPLVKSDAVVVLGGGAYDRVDQGVRLVQKGYAPRMILTEPGEVKPGSGLGSLVFRNRAIERGLPPEAITVTQQVSSSTSDEAQAVLHLMAERNFHSVIVVTEPYHTQRTRLIFWRAFAGSGITVRVYPVQGHWYRSDSWFLTEEGWGHTVRELIKLIVFGLRAVF